MEAVVEELAEDEGQLRGRLPAGGENDPAAGVVVQLDTDLMRSGRKVLLPNGPERIEVVGAPVEARPDDVDLWWEVDAREARIVLEHKRLRIGWVLVTVRRSSDMGLMEPAEHKRARRPRRCLVAFDDRSAAQ